MLTQSICLASIQISPVKVLLSEKKRSSKFNVKNTTNKKAILKIAPVSYRFNKFGKVTGSTYTGDHIARFHDKIKYTPKIITIAPSETQTVRILVTKKAIVTDKPLITHLRIENITTESTYNSVKNTSNMKTKLDAKIAYALPIIYQSRKCKKTPLGTFHTYQSKNLNTYLKWEKADKCAKFINLNIFKLNNGKRLKKIKSIIGISNYSNLLNYKLPINETLLKSNIQIEIQSSTSDETHIINHN